MTQIRANREQPITQPAKLGACCVSRVGPYRGHHRGFMPEDRRAALKAAAENAVPFGLILTAEQSKAIKAGQMVRDTTQWPENYSSIVTVEQCSDGGGISAHHSKQQLRLSQLQSAHVSPMKDYC